jgi:guanine nucleotide-binding protein subunit beta-2-like 1 protein
MLISGSRDKSIMTWKLFDEPQENVVGVPAKQFTGHNHFVSDICLSMDGNYCISSSWDKTLRLWNVKTGQTVRQFIGHKKEVFTVSFSPDNR